MWYEVVPDPQREVWVAAAQAGDEVILVSLDCTFCGVGAMKVWGHELESYVGEDARDFFDGGKLIVAQRCKRGWSWVQKSFGECAGGRGGSAC